MSVSMKSTKAAMYSEIERLRTLCDQLDQSNRALRAESEEQRAKSARPAPAAEDRDVVLSKFEIGKRLAVLLKRTVRNAPNGKFESFADGEWSEVPQRVVRYACNGGAA